MPEEEILTGQPESNRFGAVIDAEMRNREDWMNIATDPVLELLYESGLALRPKEIEVNIKRKIDDAPSRPSIERALKALEENGYVERYPNAEAMYIITDRGIEYLEGE